MIALTEARKMPIDGRDVWQRLHEPTYACDHSRVTNVRVIAFDDQDRVLVIQKNGNIDIPGGRLGWNDDTPRDAARREVWQAANIGIGKLVTSTVVEIATETILPDRFSYHLIMTGNVSAIGPRPTEPECGRRMFLARDEFLRRLENGPREEMRSLIKMAEKTYAKLFPMGCPVPHEAEIEDSLMRMSAYVPSRK